MTKIAWIGALAIALVLAPSWQAQESWREVCIQRCVSQPALGDPEMQRQEIVSLEKEAARAIQSSSGTFFYRVYSDDFAGTLSFIASDIKVRVFRETAVATCLWSARSIGKGQRISSQIRAVHFYVNTPGGWHVVSGQATNLPPDVHQPL